MALAYRRSHNKGFTLLEMLVALVLTGFLVALLSGSLHYALQAREKLTDELVNGKRALALQSWFRAVVGGAIPITGDRDERFLGKRQEFTLFTAGSLLPQQVVKPELVTLSLRKNANRDLELVYREGGKDYLLASWAEGEGEFQYFEDQGRARSEWTVEPQARTRLLPRLVKLEVRAGSRDEVFLAATNATGWLEIVPKAPFDVNTD